MKGEVNVSKVFGEGGFCASFFMGEWCRKKNKTPGVGEDNPRILENVVVFVEGGERVTAFHKTSHWGVF